MHQTKYATTCKTETPFEWVGKPVPLRYRPATGALQEPASYICNTHASQDNNTKSVEAATHTLASSKQCQINREASPICRQDKHNESIKIKQVHNVSRVGFSGPHAKTPCHESQRVQDIQLDNAPRSGADEAHHLRNVVTSCEACLSGVIQIETDQRDTARQY